MSQVSGLTLDQYVNLADQLKVALKAIRMVTPNPATEYFFQEYQETLNQPVLVDPLQRSSRARPSVGQDVVDARQGALSERVHLHQGFVEELISQAKHFWFDHSYWQRQPTNVLTLQNIGHLFNRLSECLSINQVDVVKPSHTRCGGCHQHVKIGDKRHPCVEDQGPIPSLAAEFKRVTQFVPDSFNSLVDGEVTRADLNLLCSNLKNNREEAKKWGAPDTLEGHLKYLVLEQRLTVTPAVLQLLLVGLSVACSEGVAETYGSVMEKYHKERFVNPGPANDDVRLQKEMFIRINGPPLGQSVSLCKRIASRLSVGPTLSYQQLPQVQRQCKVSKVIKRLNAEKCGFFK